MTRSGYFRFLLLVLLGCAEPAPAPNKNAPPVDLLPTDDLKTSGLFRWVGSDGVLPLQGMFATSPCCSPGYAEANSEAAQAWLLQTICQGKISGLSWPLVIRRTDGCYYHPQGLQFSTHERGGYFTWLDTNALEITTKHNCLGGDEHPVFLGCEEGSGSASGKIVRAWYAACCRYK